MIAMKEAQSRQSSHIYYVCAQLNCPDYQIGA